MCQLCGIKEAAAQARWPKPLETSIKDINFLASGRLQLDMMISLTRRQVGTAHDEYIKNNPACAKGETMPETLLEVLRLLATALEGLETDRVRWWAAPEKR